MSRDGKRYGPYGLLRLVRMSNYSIRDQWDEIRKCPSAIHICKQYLQPWFEINILLSP